MAQTFQTQVEALVGDVADTTSLSQWLQNGAWDIIHRVKMIDPTKLQSFAQQKDISNNTAVVQDNIILGVFSTDSEYREIPSALKIKATASDSIHTATSTNPVFWKENGNIYLRPTGGVSNIMSIVEIDTANLVYGNQFSHVNYFPENMKHLLVIYAAMQQLQYLMQVTQMPSDSTIDLSGIATPVLPITFTASSNMSTWDGSAQSRVIIDNATLAAAPTYEEPILESRVRFSDYTSGLTEDDPGVFSISATTPIIPVLDLPTINTSSWVQPTFVAPIFEDVDWSNTEKWIEDEEDPEMLAARVQEISAKAGEFTSKLQESQMRFTKELEIYNSQIQKSIQDATLESTKEGQEIQKYSAELQQYQAEVGAEVSAYTAKMNRWSLAIQTKSQAWAAEEGEKIQAYTAEVSNNLNVFNKENAEYQGKLQIAIENARLSSAGDGILMQRYATELQTYQAKIATKVQEYTAKFQSRGAEYKWLQEEYIILKSKYDSGFVPLQPPSKQQQD
tara:strand:+ start:1425 stop:2942 length:1518 start_codon:yes stop_codon:yes gene_type:complete